MMLNSPAVPVRLDLSLPAHRPARGRMLCSLLVGTLLCLEGAAVGAQSRELRSVPSTASTADGFTHFRVEADQTQLVHRGQAVTVGRAQDRFTSWIELPSRRVATAAVRQDEGGAHALVILLDEDHATSREFALPSARGQAQATPRLLEPRTRGTSLAVSWFEGSSLGQRELFFAQASENDGDLTFSRPKLLAPRGPGSQVALDAVTLPDGRFLATWSAFDGTDTEIMFTVGDGTSWSRPRRLHPGDDTPDSFPTLVATEDGALVAWNSLEGFTYSVMTSAFDGAGWSTPRPVVAEPGAEPLWTRGADRPLLSFRQRGQWVVVETDRSGRARRETSRVALEGRPEVLAIDERGVVLAPTQDGTPRTARRGDATRPETTATAISRLEWQP